MLNYRKALLTATYKNAIPGRMTDEHEKAEHHRFKKDFLFKQTVISDDVYISRLVQHFVIIKAIEAQLKHLPNQGKAELDAFFTLAYLEQLWRTPGIEKDLVQLGIDPEEINDEEVATHTQNYLNDIKQLSPKNLLAHFLLHVAGFMHGGNIIRSKYIAPSNRLTRYQITAHQYDFASSAAMIGKVSSTQVFEDMVNKMDDIALNKAEYQDMVAQGKHVYATIANIYDDLCEMHMSQPKLTQYWLAGVGVGLSVFAIFLRLIVDGVSLNSPSTYTPSPK